MSDDLGPLSSCGGPGDLGGEEFTEDLEAEFTVEAGARLRSRNVSGQTRIEAGADGVVTVKARKRVRGSSAEKAKRLLQNVEVRMEQHGNIIEVRPHLYEQDRGWLDLFRGGRVAVDLVITVPRDASAEAHTVSGDLAVRGIRGGLEVQSVSGDVSIDDVQGHLWLKSVSGDLSCMTFAGPVEANTVSGDVRFDRCRIDLADVMTVSGDLALTGELGSGDEHRFKSISGDVDLALAGTSYEIAYKTMSGDATLEADGCVTRDGRRDRTIVVGGGGPSVRIRVKTVSGDLRVRSARSDVPAVPAVPVPPAPPAPPARPIGAEAREVLERLALGDIPGDEPPRPPFPPGPREPVMDVLPPGLRGRVLRIQVTSGGKSKVNIAVPLSLARLGKVKMGGSGLVKGHLAKFGIDLDELLKTVERSGPIVDISDNEDRVLIVVE